LFWNCNESCIDDLTATGLETLSSEVCLKHFKELLDHSSLAQPLYAEAECSGTGYDVQQAKSNRHLKGASVFDLKFKLLVTEKE
jgi:hypothetical protein